MPSLLHSLRIIAKEIRHVKLNVLTYLRLERLLRRVFRRDIRDIRVPDRALLAEIQADTRKVRQVRRPKRGAKKPPEALSARKAPGGFAYIRGSEEPLQTGICRTTSSKKCTGGSARQAYQVKTVSPEYTCGVLLDNLPMSRPLYSRSF